MDKAFIVGTYEFIGFHLCLTLLEKGMEVVGIHIPALCDDYYLEEKRLSIGRNSNFKEMNETLFELREPFTENTILIIDYYSFYMRHKEKELNSIIKHSLDNMDIRCILFLPVQLSDEKYTNEFPLQAVKSQKHFQIYYLPTLYGPWQPLAYSFQQAIDNPEKTVQIDEREWTTDALLINDVMDHTLPRIEAKENLQILLESKIHDHWQIAASLLLKNTAIDKANEEVNVSQDVNVLGVDSTNLSDGIELQKKHLAKLRQI